MLKDSKGKKNDKDQPVNDKTHFSYDDYRKKVKRSGSYKDITVFLSVLVIGILIFLGFAKIFSPNVDVSIADNEEYADYEDDTPQGSVDERLKHLQAEDENGSGGDGIFSPELDEKVVLPKQMKKTVGEMEAEMQNEKLQQTKAEEPAKEIQKNDKDDKAKTAAAPKTESKSTAPAPKAGSYRVVVGYYATEKQAEVAKSIIQDAGLGVSPIVKNIGGSYTLQVGVYSTHERAQQEVNNLLKSNFPARISE